METNPRYRATNLAAVLSKQGRRQTWLAAELGVHKSQITHIIKGRRTVDRATADQVAALLQVPFFVLFELSSDSEMASGGIAA